MTARAAASPATATAVSPRSHRASPPRPPAEAVGAQIERLAALLSAGVTPEHAWLYLAESTPDLFVTAVAGRITAGATASDALERELARLAVGSARSRVPVASSTTRRGGGHTGENARATQRAWAVLAAAWFTAAESGAPLAECLAGIAEAQRGIGAVEREIRVALSGPVATSRLVVVLPIVSLAGGGLLGLDPLGTIVSNPLALACAIGGVLLMTIAALWGRGMLARARRTDPAPGLVLDLVAVALAGGGAVPQACSTSLRALARAGLVASTAMSAAARPMATIPAATAATAVPSLYATAPDTVALNAVLSLAQRAGAPPGDLLRREAARLRRDAVGAAAERAAALGIWLLLPLGLCVLPAFILLTVAPVLIGVITSTAL